MTRLPRVQLLLVLLPLSAGLITGMSGAAAAVIYALAQNWTPAGWAALAAGWSFVVITHRCPLPPAPAPVKRGLQCVHFIGGPEDGGSSILPGTARDLYDTTMTVDGTDYRVGAVEQTCYRAELAPDREVAR